MKNLDRTLTKTLSPSRKNAQNSFVYWLELFLVFPTVKETRAFLD
jgi:hypothetical protein